MCGDILFFEIFWVMVCIVSTILLFCKQQHYDQLQTVECGYMCSGVFGHSSLRVIRTEVQNSAHTPKLEMQLESLKRWTGTQL